MATGLFAIASSVTLCVIENLLTTSIILMWVMAGL